MAGIYIHVPFCKTICHYCDFYKTANTRLLPAYIDSLTKEIVYRRNFLSEDISTIYFGGGTPSVLNHLQLSVVLDTIRSNFALRDSLEITMELNPDDCTSDYLDQLYSIGITRLSIGNQSFNDTILTYLNRRHNAAYSIAAIEKSFKAGFTNISADLIYGIPNQTPANFLKDLNLLCDLGIHHLSAYHLTIESGTYFGKLKKVGKLSEISEEVSDDFYKVLIDWAQNNYFEHYEVSNFAKNKMYSSHNMNYWFSIPYLGVGPSAHSFDGNNRFMNISNINKYIDSIADDNLTIEKDALSEKDSFNEFILLRLRTRWGIDLIELKERFNTVYWHHFVRIAEKYLNSVYVRKSSDHFILSEKGLFVSDYIVREFFLV